MARKKWRPGDPLPLFGGGPRDFVLVALAQRGNTPGRRLATVTGRDISATFKSLRILQRSGLVGRDENLRWVIDRRHPAHRELRLLMRRVGTVYGLDYASVTGYQNGPAVSPFPDLEAVPADELDNQTRTRVLLYVAATGPCSTLEIVDALDSSLRVVYVVLQHFRQCGILDALIAPSGQTVIGVRLTRGHPAASELRKFLKAMIRHVHPEFAALKMSRRHRLRLQQRLRINAIAQAAGVDPADWNVVPYRGRSRR